MIISKKAISTAKKELQEISGKIDELNAERFLERQELKLLKSHSMLEIDMKIAALHEERSELKRRILDNIWNKIES